MARYADVAKHAYLILHEQHYCRPPPPGSDPGQSNGQHGVETVARTGIAQMPKKGERALGGHAVMAVGYNQKTTRFLVRNSWGEGWGMKGYFTMPFEYLETLAADFWTVRK